MAEKEIIIGLTKEEIVGLLYAVKVSLSRLPRNPYIREPLGAAVKKLGKAIEEKKNGKATDSPE